MGSYVIPDVVQRFSGVKVELWHWLEKEIGNRDGPFEINQGELADRFNVSRTSIINALKTFVSANLLEKVSSERGRGNHSRYRLKWTFREENVTPIPRVECNPQDVQTKGRRKWRFYAYKFRTTVENSSLASKSQVVVGKILSYLKGKPPDLFQETLIYLKRWLSEETRTLKGFFAEFYHKILKSLAQSRRELKETKEFIREQREQRREGTKEYQSNPPPRLRDYKSFADYQKAMQKWSDDSSKQEGSKGQSVGTARGD